MRLPIAIATLGLLTVSTVAVAAEDPPCVSYKEFAQIHKGMTPKQVAEVVGYSGKKQWRFRGEGYRFLSRTYKPCAGQRKNSSVSVDYIAKNGEPFGVEMKVMNVTVVWPVP